MAYAYGWGAGCGFGLGFLNFIGTILFIIALFWVLRFFMRGGFGGNGRWGGWRGSYRGRHAWRHRHHLFSDDALEEARGRLARGEIDAQEYERLRSALEGDDPGGTVGDTPFDRWVSARTDAMELLRQRLARGEIDVEEFERLRAALQH